MKLLSAALLNHDASISIMEDGHLIKYILAEGKSRKKHDFEKLHLFQEEFKKCRDMSVLMLILFQITMIIVSISINRV